MFAWPSRPFSIFIYSHNCLGKCLRVLSTLEIPKTPYRRV
jgi:hypothetical protein